MNSALNTTISKTLFLRVLRSKLDLYINLRYEPSPDYRENKLAKDRVEELTKLLLYVSKAHNTTEQ